MPSLNQILVWILAERFRNRRRIEWASYRRCRDRVRRETFQGYLDQLTSVQFRWALHSVLMVLVRLRLVRVNRTSKKWRTLNPEKMAKCQRRWFLANKARVLARQVVRNKKRAEADPAFRLGNILRGQLNKFVKYAKRGHRTIEFIGCTIDQLKQHIERQFKAGMSWDNYGIGGWEIDHILPVSSFDLSNPIQVKQCWHFSNMRPLWRKENITKHAKIGFEFGNTQPLLTL